MPVTIDPKDRAKLSIAAAREYLRLGDLSRERGRLAEARSFYERSLAHDCECPRARTLVAELRSRSSSPTPENPTLSLPSDELGRLATRYRLLREIGRGGTGSVFLAEDMPLGRRVALKVLHSARRMGEGRLFRLLEEARIAAGISHPGVVRTFDMEPRQGVVVMEHLGGGSLRSRLTRHGSIEVPICLALGLGLCRALEALGEHGLAHGDLKPANVLFHHGGPEALADPVLVDFGMARLVEQGGPEAGDLPPGAPPDHGSAGGGTLAFMAPEQRLGAPPSARTDLYSLGVILFEALTGRPPFRKADLLSSIPPAPPPLPHDVPKDTRLLVEDLLAPLPSDRPAGPARVAARITEALRERSGASRQECS